MRPWLAFLLLLTGACAEDTRVFLDLDATPAARANVQQAHVRICNEEDTTVFDEMFAVTADIDPTWPLRIELTPQGDDATRVYWALARTLDASGLLVEDRVVVSGYEDGQELIHPVLFDASCVGVSPCPAGQTCDAGVCVDARRAPLDLGAPALPTPPACAPAGIACEGVSGVLFCDGFEGPDPLTDPWGTSLDTGTIDIVTDEVFSGSHAARSTTTESGGEARLNADIGSVTGPMLHGRGWFRVEEGGEFEHMELLRLEENSPRRAFGVRVLRGGAIELIERDETRNDAISTPLSAPFGRWFCLRIAIDIAADGVLSVAVDDESFDVTGIDTLPTDGYDRGAAGISISADAPGVAWTDEVTFATEPLSCRR